MTIERVESPDQEKIGSGSAIGLDNPGGLGGHSLESA
jgi:hypothetical protein